MALPLQISHVILRLQRAKGKVQKLTLQKFPDNGFDNLLRIPGIGVFPKYSVTKIFKF